MTNQTSKVNDNYLVSEEQLIIACSLKDLINLHFIQIAKNYSKRLTKHTDWSVFIIKFELKKNASQTWSM